jgi:hypothetical protein
MKKIDILIFRVFTFILILTSCEKGDNGPEKIRIVIGDAAYQPDFLYDSCGGYWLKIPVSDLSNN